MEQLNKKRSQDDRVRYDNDVGIDRDVGYSRQTRPPNIKYHDTQAAPKRNVQGIAFADIVRNKSAPPGILREKTPKETSVPTEIYKEKITLESYKSDFVVFKNFLYDAKALLRVESKDFTGLLTVRDYSNRLSTDNEKYKRR